jgi:hypothetical protein
VERRGFLGKCFIPSWKAPNRPPIRHLGALSLDNTMGTEVGKVVFDNTWKWAREAPVVVQAHQGCGHTPTRPKWPHLQCDASFGPLSGSCKILHHLELIWYEFWPFFSIWLGPDLPSKWAFSPWAHVGWCYALFFVYFWHISCVIPICPPVNN